LIKINFFGEIKKMKNNFELIKESAEQSTIPYGEYIEGALKLLSMGISINEVLRIMKEREE
jgi:hypothetical protein